MDWDQYFCSIMYLVAMKSEDPNTRIGAILVDQHNNIRSTGFNCFPRGVDTQPQDRHIAPEKYFFYEHAERNSIFSAARAGTATLGCVMYTNGVPCADCARACIQAGISKVVVSAAWDKNDGRAKWQESCARGIAMLKEAGVEVVTYTGPYVTEVTAMRGGKPLDIKD